LNPASVLIGDAPIQGCKWDKMISVFLINSIHDLSIRYKVPVRVEDFRRRVYDVSKNNPLSELRPLSDYLVFDLATKSNLESVTAAGTTRFRVNNYDPDRMVKVHAPGKHMYCLIREFFISDIIIQLPKIKTHQKTGITGALKNLVGINGDKDFLPHHRMGGTASGGDCYPGGSALRHFSELALDQANRNQGKSSFWYWQKFSSLLWHMSFPGPEHNVDAGWYGNDTSWRMVADLNLIGLYGRADGTLSDEPQRQIYSLCDAVIAGQGDGPLEPQPLDLGILSFTNDSVSNDLAMAILMGLPLEKIPLLNQYAKEMSYPCPVIFNGTEISYEALKKHAVRAIPPKGWIAYLNATP
jgi:hypothetical protein